MIAWSDAYIYIDTSIYSDIMKRERVGPPRVQIRGRPSSVFEKVPTAE